MQESRDPKNAKMREWGQCCQMLLTRLCHIASKLCHIMSQGPKLCH